MKLTFLMCCAITALMPAPILAAQDCRTISDSLERLRCYDSASPATSIAPESKPAAPIAAPDDPLIAKAKAAIRKQLREPGSAKYQGIKIKTAADGKKGVCGMVSAKNAMGGMTGMNFFVYDGEHVGILVTGGMADNPTSFGPDILALTVSNGLKKYEIFCGKVG